MNPMTIRLALKGAGSAVSYFRNLDKDKQREIYDSLIDALKNDKVEGINDLAHIDELEDLYSAARREAGAITRNAHDRLDRRRAAFAAAAPSRAERRKALKQEAKDAKKKSKSSGGKAAAGFATLAALAAAAGAGWAVWECVIKERKEAPTSTPAKPSGATKPGESTLVYSSRTEDDKSDKAQVAGPLGEEPAVRDEELLSSIDEQLSTLDTLDNDQRGSTRL
ncbi:hypothetical protein [Corynebacterium liangguodongii]|uniref:Uncharacterized protein n=1 Tax=Corynebacterium liangguodongii TaxID=2079535 RepID=A0A2S0WBF8_9CORY|nr:hypothetical protein [Corynebacterium liangguodongii]AWB83098.1 hypothetical protein C3E79_00165 [Corynebacterium liangguodongii]PWB99301.1 hypothetical protein DF219_06910 [Corynebacterium liangguodongii]